MPTSSLLKRFYDMYRESKNFTPTNLFILARYYGVSVEAIANRLGEMENFCLLELGRDCTTVV